MGAERAPFWQNNFRVSVIREQIVFRGQLSWLENCTAPDAKHVVKIVPVLFPVIRDKMRSASRFSPYPETPLESALFGAEMFHRSPLLFAYQSSENLQSVRVSASTWQSARYLIVQNATSPQADFSYWESAEQAIRFREALSPIVIRMEFRLAELENPARQHGVRLGQVATRQNAINELKRASIVMRAEKLSAAALL
jgi:hypothetical protein